MAIKYGELIQQFKFKIKVYANVRYEKKSGEEPTEIINHHIPIENIDNLTRIQLSEIDALNSVDNEIQRQETQGSGWNLQGIIYLKLYIHKTNALNGMTFVKFPKRTKSILNFQNIDTYCFLWSILASSHPVDERSPTCYKYEPYRDELNFTNKDFTKGRRIVDIPRFEKLNPTLAINVFEFSSEEDNDYKIVALYVSKHKENRRNLDPILYKNLCILIKKLHVFISKHDSHYVCRNCLKNCTNQSELAIHIWICGNNGKSVHIPCKENHVEWDKFYQKMPIYSLIIADFKARNEFLSDQDKQHCRTIDICKEIPCCNVFYVINKLNDLPIEMGYYKSHFGQNNISWFLNKINNIEFQMSEFFKLNRKPKKTIKSHKLFLKANFCWLCDKKIRDMDDKVKHYCKLSGNYLRAAHHQSCTDYVKQVDQQKFIPVLYHNFSKYDNHMFFNDLINSEVDKFKLTVIPRTKEEYMCVNYGCVKFLDSMRFQQDSLVKNNRIFKRSRLYALKTTFSKSLDVT